MTQPPKDYASMGPPIYIGGNYPGWYIWNAPVHRFNGATDLHRWKRRGMALQEAAGKSFNGATDLHRWKPAGNHSRIAIRRRGFNGATDLHRWKPSLSPGGIHRRYCFNGATDLHRWKPLENPHFAGVARLQWGHRFTSVETPPLARPPPNIPPLQWGHRFTSVETLSKK